MNKKLNMETFLEYFVILLVVAGIDIIGNFVGYKTGILEALPGMLILFAVALVGITLSKIIPYNVPSIVYISIIGVLIAMPYSPISGPVLAYTGKVNMLCLATPVLAFSGLTMGKNWAEFKRLGWKGILVTMCVMFGTFLGSALIAQYVLKYQGVI